MHIKNPSIMNQLTLDCCSTSINPDHDFFTLPYIQCDSNQRVTDINWYSMNLDGFINGTALVPKLKRLNLYSNSLKGVLPLVFPNSLYFLDVGTNQLTGDLPVFPINLVYLYLAWPGLQGNHFTGNVIANQLIDFIINDNLITDVLLTDASQLSFCDLSNNPLLGNQHIASWSTCTKNNLYSASLLPNTQSTFKTNSVKLPSTIFKITSTTAGVLTVSKITTTATKKMTVVPFVIQQIVSAKSISTSTLASKYLTDISSTSFTMQFGSSVIPNMTDATSEITKTTNLGWVKSTGTVAFVQENRKFPFTLNMIVRIVINAVALNSVFMKTPFLREFRGTIKKRTTKETSSSAF
jgi:hypothetical protein